MRKNVLTDETAHRVYDVLVKEAGAPERDRQAFVAYTTTHGLDEWRFIGVLGFGGKARYGGYPAQFYVDCYPEDLTPERQLVIERANRALQLDGVWTVAA
jgi:hypothetical protein